MGIIRHCKHQGSIDELACCYDAFSQLKNAQVHRVPNRTWRNQESGVYSYDALAVFVGKTGYGKSSTVNAFFGKSVLKTSDVAACTRECQSLDFKLSPECNFSLGDLPGIGESEYRDQEYLKMYRDFLDFSTVVVYVLRADTRDYAVDEAAYKQLFNTYADRRKVVLALNYCDKIEPISRSMSVEPSSAQMQNIAKKLESVNGVFNPVNRVIPYSAATGWNMNTLADTIVKIVARSDEITLSSKYR